MILIVMIMSNENNKLKIMINNPAKAIQYVYKKSKDFHVIFKLKNQYDKEELYIPMRDGVKLYTSVYSPKEHSQSYPILLYRTPYNSEPKENGFSHRLPNMQHILKEKYIIAFQDVRGRYQSEGEFVNIRPFEPNKNNNEIDENTDAFDTIDWLINYIPNNNGKVGIFGISYSGFYATMALPNAHPALKAVSPQAPILDWFNGDDWHHNGAFFLLDAFTFFELNGKHRRNLTREYPSPYDYQGKDIYNFFKDIGPVRNIQEYFFGDSIQFWSELLAHPNYDEFWQKRNILQYLSEIKPAVLTVGGWFDPENLYGPLNLYKTIEVQDTVKNQNRMIFGPWYHGQWIWDDGKKVGNIRFNSKTSEYFKKIELQFFNYYLKNIGNMNLPDLSIFVTGANEWRSFEKWPPEDVNEEYLYLYCNGILSFSEPHIEACYIEYITDPNNPIPYVEYVHSSKLHEFLTDDQRYCSNRADVLVFKTELLDNDITIVGPIEVDLFTSTTGTDADYIVKIIDVFPDEVNNNFKSIMAGYQMLVRSEVLRGKYRNSLATPKPITPNRITEISFEMPDIAHQFKEGHRIMIQIQNSSFPLIDINPQQFVNIYEADQDDFVKATHRIYCDYFHPSKIAVNILNN